MHNWDQDHDHILNKIKPDQRISGRDDIHIYPHAHWIVTVKRTGTELAQFKVHTHVTYWNYNKDLFLDILFVEKY